MLGKLFSKFKMAPSVGQLIEEVPEHFEKHVGPLGMVFHELVSTDVHIDVHIVEPSPACPYKIIFSTGMSMKRLRCKADTPALVELMMVLPPDWDLSEAGIDSPEAYWPIEILKFNTRWPHDEGFCLREHISVPFADPPEPAPGSPFHGVMVCKPTFLPPQAQQVRLSSGETIQLYALMPLTLPEMTHKATQPEADGFLQYLRQQNKLGIEMFCCDPSRPSAI